MPLWAAELPWSCWNTSLQIPKLLVESPGAAQGLEDFSSSFIQMLATPPHVCVSLTAEGQGRTLKAIQLFLAPSCAGEITLPEMHSCAKRQII